MIVKNYLDQVKHKVYRNDTAKNIETSISKIGQKSFLNTQSIQKESCENCANLTIKSVQKSHSIGSRRTVRLSGNM